MVTCKSDVTVGGTVSGLTGTVVLLNTATYKDATGTVIKREDTLATASNGSFTFTAPVKNGAVYGVLVKDQPLGQACSTENYTGIATDDVTNVIVVCKHFVVRPLPAIYSTGQSVNYSAFRAGGPVAGEIPSDADVAAGPRS